MRDNRPISLPSGAEDSFNLGKLVISIARACAHSPEKSNYDALWLAQSVEDILSTDYATITPDDIAAVTHQVLKRYDELAAIQYAAQHQLISSTRRRGRPSLSPAAREQRTDESPSL